MAHPKFEILLAQQTTESSLAFLRNLDAQIEEFQTQLQMLQTLRRVTAATFGVDRTENGSNIKRMTESANRAHLEGEGEDSPDGRLKTAAA